MDRQIENLDDPVHLKSPVFSYYSESHCSLYEVKFAHMNSAYFDKLYVMLSKIHLYNLSVSPSKRLSLHLITACDGVCGVGDDCILKIRQFFSPSVQDGLLIIEEKIEVPFLK